MAKQKFYVVWNGFVPGVYKTWDECHQQIKGFEKAIYKSFASAELAQHAFNDHYSNYIGSQNNGIMAAAAKGNISNPPLAESLCVDAACDGQPGNLEYRGVNTSTREIIFSQGPFKKGTNNVGEFLALVHALALLKKQNNPLPVYSDSEIAIRWVVQKRCATKLKPEADNQILFERIERAENWLKSQNQVNRILKWHTDKWGEIPADYGRK